MSNARQYWSGILKRAFKENRVGFGVGVAVLIVAAVVQWFFFKTKDFPTLISRIIATVAVSMGHWIAHVIRLPAMIEAEKAADAASHVKAIEKAMTETIKAKDAEIARLRLENERLLSITNSRILMPTQAQVSEFGVPYQTKENLILKAIAGPQKTQPLSAFVVDTKEEHIEGEPKL